VKFDKEMIIALIVCAIVLMGWNPFCKMMGWLPEAAPAQIAGTAQQPAPVQTENTATGNAGLPVVKNVTAQSKAVVPEKSVAPMLLNIPPQSISNKFMTQEFAPAEGILKSVTLENYFNSAKTSKLVLDKNISPGALGVFADSAWTVLEVVDNSKTESNIYTLVRKIADVKGRNFLLTQTWKITDEYSTSYQLRFKNVDKVAIQFGSVSVVGGGLQPFAVLSGDNIRQETHNVDFITVDGKFYDIKADVDSDVDFNLNPGLNILWAGISNKYFTTILLPEKPCRLFQKRERFNETSSNGKSVDYYTAAIGGRYDNVIVEPGQEVVFNLKYYAGPKIITELKKFDPSTAKIMHLAWGPLDWLARILLSSLVFLKSFCGSYGWSIVILTIIVRLLFWPITQKANGSMKKMQKLQPKIKEIKEKYKSDPQIMNSKVMALYKEEKVNPVGGCLPILLQIPVFFALYATLDGAVELRQVPFLWAADLAQPDTVAILFGVPLNPLVLAMTGLMVVQQKLQPAAMDPMQQKMMMMMPVVMLFFLYSLPAGLTLYWTVSQVFSIIQLLVQKNAGKNETNQQLKTV